MRDDMLSVFKKLVIRLIAFLDRRKHIPTKYVVLIMLYILKKEIKQWLDLVKKLSYFKTLGDKLLEYYGWCSKPVDLGLRRRLENGNTV